MALVPLTINPANGSSKPKELSVSSLKSKDNEENPSVKISVLYRLSDSFLENISEWNAFPVYVLLHYTKSFSTDSAFQSLIIKQINSIMHSMELRKIYACKGHSIASDDY